MAIFGHFSQKSLFLAIFPIFCPVATGLFFSNLAKNGQNPQMGLKVPDREIPRGGFYINPSRRGPVPGFRGVQKMGDFGPRRGLADFPGSGIPGLPAPAGDRAPPRGVDVKPRTRGRLSRLRSPGAGPGTPRGSPEPSPGARPRELGSRISTSGSGPGLGRGLPDPGRSQGAPRPPRGLFYINPSRRGPAPWRRGEPLKGAGGKSPSHRSA